MILEGGQDWLTYESYARDILLNGPLMTLGEPLGKGKPFFFQPFYPYYLAAMHWLTGEGLWGPIVLQLFGDGVAGVLVYFLAKRLFGVRAAWRRWRSSWCSGCHSLTGSPASCSPRTCTSSCCRPRCCW